MWARSGQNRVGWQRRCRREWMGTKLENARQVVAGDRTRTMEDAGAPLREAWYYATPSHTLRRRAFRVAKFMPPSRHAAQRRAFPRGRDRMLLSRLAVRHRWAVHADPRAGRRPAVFARAYPHPQLS